MNKQIIAAWLSRPDRFSFNFAKKPTAARVEPVAKAEDTKSLWARAIARLGK